MGWVAAAGLALKGISQAMEASEQRKAAKQQEEMAEQQRLLSEQNAQREAAENLEQQRRMSAHQGQMESRSRAMAAASGLETSGFAPSGSSSIALALSEQQRENRQQLAWEQSAGASRVDIMRRGGELKAETAKQEAKSMKRKSTASFVGAAGSFLGAGSSGYSWWTK
jgi:hypothetical protein